MIVNFIFFLEQQLQGINNLIEMIDIESKLNRKRILNILNDNNMLHHNANIIHLNIE